MTLPPPKTKSTPPRVALLTLWVPVSGARGARFILYHDATFHLQPPRQGGSAPGRPSNQHQDLRGAIGHDGGYEALRGRLVYCYWCAQTQNPWLVGRNLQGGHVTSSQTHNPRSGWAHYANFREGNFPRPQSPDQREWKIPDPRFPANTPNFDWRSTGKAIYSWSKFDKN